jgi:hypothetical protein
LTFFTRAQAKNGNFMPMDTTKLRLSAEELRLVTDPGIILTKNAIIEKVYILFGALADDFRNKLTLPDEVTSISPKIARGENYLGLPYVMFDYPRYFTNADILAIRSFFWWGNFFSITLHLKGVYSEMATDGIMSHYPMLLKQGYSIAIADEEWHHHFGNDNYRRISSMEEHEFRLYITGHPYIKIARIFPLAEWEYMREQFNKAFEEIGCLISQPVK